MSTSLCLIGHLLLSLALATEAALEAAGPEASGPRPAPAEQPSTLHPNCSVPMAARVERKTRGCLFLEHCTLCNNSKCAPTLEADLRLEQAVVGVRRESLNRIQICRAFAQIASMDPFAGCPSVDVLSDTIQRASFPVFNASVHTLILEAANDSTDNSTANETSAYFPVAGPRGAVAFLVDNCVSLPYPEAEQSGLPASAQICGTAREVKYEAMVLACSSAPLPTCNLGYPEAWNASCELEAANFLGVSPRLARRHANTIRDYANSCNSKNTKAACHGHDTQYYQNAVTRSLDQMLSSSSALHASTLLQLALLAILECIL